MLARTVLYFDLSRTLPRKLRLPWLCSLKVLARDWEKLPTNSFSW